MKKGFKKLTKKTLGLLVAILMLVSSFINPITVLATSREDLRVIPAHDLEDSGRHFDMSLSSSGILTWTQQEGATGYKVYINDFVSLEHGRRVSGIYDTATTSYNIKNLMDTEKLASGKYEIVVVQDGAYVGAETNPQNRESMFMTYISVYDELEAPTNVVWNDNRVTWDAVPNATGYRYEIYSSNGEHVGSSNTSNTQTAILPSSEDGWYVKVQATAPNYRDSQYKESPLKDTGISTTYTCSFNSNGGTGTMADVTELTGTYTLPANGFTAPTNKQFKGWSLTSDGAIITTVSMVENRTVYAIWEDIPTTYTISVHSYDETLGQLNSGGEVYLYTDHGTDDWSTTGYSKEATANTNVAINEDVLPGYEFVSWRVGSPTGEVFSTDDAPSFYATRNLDLYAIFRQTSSSTTHDVTFNLNGGTWTDTGTNVVTVNDGAKVTEPSAPTKDGYVFAGWYDTSGFTSEFDFDNTTIEADGTIIYAKWNEIITSANATVTAPVGNAHPDFNPVVPDGVHYTISVDTWYLHESPYPDLTNESTFETGKEYSLRVHFIPNEGYAFTNDTTFTMNGEAISKYGTTGDREYSKVATAPAVTTYKVTFNSNGGSGTMADVTGLTGTYTLPANGFTAPTNKQFKGWSLTEDGSIITTVEMTENRTIYAVWEDIPEETLTITGDNQTFTLGNTNDITITCSGALTELTAIKVNGVVLEEANRELASGSTVLTLKNAYLNTLSAGTYTVTFEYGANSKDATLNVVEATNNDNNNNNNDNTNINDNTNTNTNNNTSNNPQTSYNVVDYIYTLIIGIICLAGGTVYLKRKKLFENR